MENNYITKESVSKVFGIMQVIVICLASIIASYYAGKTHAYAEIIISLTSKVAEERAKELIYD